MMREYTISYRHGNHTTMRRHALMAQDETGVQHKPQYNPVSLRDRTWDPSIGIPGVTTRLTTPLAVVGPLHIKS